MNESILFITGDFYISPDAAGGISTLAHNHLELLHHAGYKIHLLLLGKGEQPGEFAEFQRVQSEIWREVQSWLESVNYIQLREDDIRANIKSDLLASIFSPVRYFYRYVNDKNLNQIQNLISDFDISLIWGEHLQPALLADHLHLKSKIPVIYSHHDWSYRLAGYRQKKLSLRKRLYLHLKKRIEIKLVRSVAGCVSGSRTETEEILILGAKKALYLPALYAIPDPGEKFDSNAKPRVVHFGGLKATANRLGLERFMEICWPDLTSKNVIPFEFWIVGSLNGATPALNSQLKSHAVCTGFVKDLGTVFRPYDIQIVPWEYNTGTRTRLPVAMAYRQVIVSTKAAASCLPELIDHKNCLLVDSLEEMTDDLLSLIEDPGLRKRLGDQGRKLYERTFTRVSNQITFEKYLKSIES